MPSEYHLSGPTIRTITSSDGTHIAFERHGDGPPLVLLHGSTGTRRAWDAVVPHLSDDFTLIIPDRRGRGASGDADGYSLKREIDDLQAVLNKIDGKTTVFGHSFGGLVTLAATDQITVDRTVLYEPTVLVDEFRDDDLAARMKQRLDAVGRQEAMRLFFEDAVGVPAPERLAFWPEAVRFDLVETVIRETKAVESYEPPATPEIDCPTLLMTGENGPDHLRTAVQMLADRVPQSHLVEFEGVGHVGTQSVPEQITDVVRSFCHEDTQ